MAYELTIRDAVVGTLRDRVSTTADSVNALLRAGYNPNKAKLNILSLGDILIRAYQNIEIFDEEQAKDLDRLFNKLMNL